ncbi:MAG: hypothetical protein IPJ00_17355 [Saprospirales bacterium]|nr:hypothetical protein [Saprospirales bacterium]
MGYDNSDFLMEQFLPSQNRPDETGLTRDQVAEILNSRGWKKYGDMQFIKDASVMHLYQSRLRFWEDLRAASVVCNFDLPISESDLNGLIGEPPFYCLDEGDGKPRCQVQCPYCEKGL